MEQIIQNIILALGLSISFLGAWLMKKAANGEGRQTVPPETNMYKRGLNYLSFGFCLQFMGVWFPQISQAISSAVVSTPAVYTLSEFWDTLLGCLKQNEPLLYAVIVILTGFAAGAAWRSASKTEQATQAQLYSRLMEEYGSQRMFNALRGIKKFSELKGIPRALAELSKILLEGRRLNDDKEQRHHYTHYSDTITQELGKRDNFNSDRRVVKYYFLKLLRLHENNFLSENLMQALGKVAVIDIFYDVIQPIEFAKKEDFNVSNFEKIEKICGRYDEGR
jgi:hypothetical protein